MLTHEKRTPARWSPLHSGRETQSYYVSRPAPPPEAYAGYWKPKADPDGITRDRSGERDIYLEDLGGAGCFSWLERLQSRQPQARSRVLDVGCGPGWLLSALDEEQWDKHGVEICEDAVDEARQHGKVLCGTLQEARYPEEMFDAVFCHHVIEHDPDPIDLIHEIRRVLKRGGGLILATPDFGSPCAKRFGANYRMLHDTTHVSLFTLESATRMLTEVGFTIEDVQFPFPERYCTAETMERWRRGPVDGEWSPPWPGNWMSFFCEK